MHGYRKYGIGELQNASLGFRVFVGGHKIPEGTMFCCDTSSLVNLMDL